MRHAVLLITVFFVSAFRLCGAEPLGGSRSEENFNRGWTFVLGDPEGAAAPGFNDGAWSPVNIPHSFSIPYFLSEKFHTGFGWYRKHFDVPPAWAGKRVFLEFEGVFQDAEVFVNGKAVGRHVGGYTGFSFDITESLTPGDNTVAVRVNNNWNPVVPPRAGEHVFSGGIYRDVRLVVTDPLHVTWYGTFVTTPKVSKESAEVKVETEVRNDSDASKDCTLKTKILDPDGREVAEWTATQRIAAGTTAVITQTGAPLEAPKLWHPEHPHLYRAVTTVLDGGKPVDRFETPFGIRWFEWTADKGFFLNGEHHYFRGANAHQDHAGWGDAVTNRALERDVRQIKDAGFDFIRGSHYPHDPAFSAACDRLGMLFWSENAFWGTGGFKDAEWSCSAYPPEEKHQAEFDENALRLLGEMIRIHRNHPSIVVWSMCNEVFFTADSTLPKTRELLKKLVQRTHELDPTRPAAIGGCQRGEMDKLGDIAGYNGDGARLFMDPGIPNVVSEYGSTIADRPGAYAPGWGDLQRERYPWRSGEVLWCAFDHGSIAGHFGCMGMVDYFRLPKRQWFWYRNEYRKIPPPAWPENGTPARLRLEADRATIESADGTDDVMLTVTVLDAAGKPIANNVPVTLTLESGPGEFPTGPSITFAPGSDIAIRDGQAAIGFRTYHAGRSVIRATSPGLEDAVVEITSKGGPGFIPGKTPPVKPRPYVRFTGKASAALDHGLGQKNPTRAGSEAAGHSARLANDGNPATFWKADASGGNWWQVDLERIVAVSGVQLTFPSAAERRYSVEGSLDGQSWSPIAEGEASPADPVLRPLSPKAPVSARYLRVTIPGGEPALAEFSASGTVQP